ncbi:MAG: serine/threonine protein kinase, partial [Deltaproteobacteria bacterium]|nr:serine/threonine protein kinase [Deltaproteobacteria bacterium]
MEPGSKIGKYEIVDFLGKGGMAEVYLAVLKGAAGFQKKVAIKRILPGLYSLEGFQAMFAREAKLVAGISHEKVVQVYDFDYIKEIGFYIAMEYVDGCDLSSLWKVFKERNQPIPVSLCIRIVLDLCEALSHLHSLKDEQGRRLGLVHRDLSPQNVLLSRDGCVKLTDFGIAKAYDAALGETTRTGLIKGKSAYMSPEQTRGETLDAASDVFSLGILFWELLTGRRLFKEQDDLASLLAVRGKDVTPPSAIRDDLPDGLDRVVLKSLKRDKGKRYTNARQLMEDLEPFAGKFLGAKGKELIGNTVTSFLENSLFTDFRNEPVDEAGSKFETRFKPENVTKGWSSTWSRIGLIGVLTVMILAGLFMAFFFNKTDGSVSSMPGNAGKAGISKDTVPLMDSKSRAASAREKVHAGKGLEFSKVDEKKVERENTGSSGVNGKNSGVVKDLETGMEKPGDSIKKGARPGDSAGRVGGKPMVRVGG